MTEGFGIYDLGQLTRVDKLAKWSLTHIIFFILCNWCASLACLIGQVIIVNIGEFYQPLWSSVKLVDSNFLVKLRSFSIKG